MPTLFGKFVTHLASFDGELPGCCDCCSVQFHPQQNIISFFTDKECCQSNLCIDCFPNWFEVFKRDPCHRCTMNVGIEPQVKLSDAIELTVLFNKLDHEQNHEVQEEAWHDIRDRVFSFRRDMIKTGTENRNEVCKGMSRTKDELADVFNLKALDEVCRRYQEPLAGLDTYFSQLQKFTTIQAAYYKGEINHFSAMVQVEWMFESYMHEKVSSVANEIIETAFRAALTNAVDDKLPVSATINFVNLFTACDRKYNEDWQIPSFDHNCPICMDAASSYKSNSASNSNTSSTSSSDSTEYYFEDYFSL